MRDVAIAVADGETLGALVDEEGGDLLALAARAVLFAGRHEDDREIGDVGMADEMLGAVEHPVAAILDGRRLHAAQVGAGAGLGHGQAIRLLAADAREQIFLALLGRAGEQDVRRPRHAGPVQRIVGAAELLFVEQPGRRIQPGAADIGRHVGGIEPGGDRLGLELLDKLAAQMTAALHLLLMRVELVLDEGARRLDDQALLVGKAEIHRSALLLPPDFFFAFFGLSVFLGLSALAFAAADFEAFGFFAASLASCLV